MINADIELAEESIWPSRAHADDSGYDLFALYEPKIVGSKSEIIGGIQYWNSIDYIEYQTGVKLGNPHEIIPANIFEDFSVDQQKPFYTLLFPRSSISKYNLTLANSVGVVDHGYTGPVSCRFRYNFQPSDLRVLSHPLCNGMVVGAVNMEKVYRKGDKICQLVPMSLQSSIKFNRVDKVGATARGSGGFGSTGK